ncbi:MAG: putative lipid II flippase FtsW [Oscillospiraceae bacterium]|nr:putative lipid II flippase FtsW [Oscillospiraceae bacterium]
MSADFDKYIDAGANGMPQWQPRELSSGYDAKRDAKTREKRGSIDLPFLLLTLLILLIGVVMVLSASFARAYIVTGNPLRFFSRQLVFAVSGVALMMVVSRIRVSMMQRWSMLLLFGSIALLVLVLIFGDVINGARRWINLGFTTVQPSEITKLAVIMAYAAMICGFEKKMHKFKYGILPFVFFTGVIVILLLRQPHLSASIIIIAQTAIMMFAGGAPLRWFVIPMVLIIAVVGLILIPAHRPVAEAPAPAGQEIVQEQPQQRGGRFSYAGGRIGAWLDPEADPLGRGFQIRQSLYAVGSGGLFGVGLGQSRQKFLYLPEEHNDYIFAIVSEELGFIGAMIILSLFALLVMRGFWLALHAKDRFSSLVTTGITSLLAIQVFLNVAVVTNLVPATGISLPFFSYGGTALWIQLLQMGIVLAVSRDIPLTKAG